MKDKELEEATAKKLINEFSGLSPGLKKTTNNVSVYIEDINHAKACAITHIKLIIAATPSIGKYTKDKYQVNIEFWKAVLKIIKSL